jgi:glycine amidinotransferase/scyllo-inosamine-4-phosphate amidinotransferase 1
MIDTRNEWDALKRIVVGIADYANWPSTDPVFALESQKTTWQATPIPSGPVPDWIIAEANEDLDVLASTLEQLGVEVWRPAVMNFQQLGGMYNYCPRDRFLVYGDTVVDCAMMYPCRDMEREALYHVTLSAGRTVVMPKDQNLVLDAANICRLGDTWLFLESASGNRAAYEWLCDQFPAVTIELCNFYSGVHIDSTIVPLRDGLVLLNASRVSAETCPRVFRDWECVYIHDVVPQDFYQYPYASKWIAMNMLVVDPHTVIVDAAQTNLIQILLNHSFEVIPLTLRHSRTLGGGFHCVTLDLLRSVK